MSATHCHPPAKRRADSKNADLPKSRRVFPVLNDPLVRSSGGVAGRDDLYRRGLPCRLARRRASRRDIAYSSSPAALRASARSVKSSIDAIRAVHDVGVGSSDIARPVSRSGHDSPYRVGMEGEADASRLPASARGRAPADRHLGESGFDLPCRGTGLSSGRARSGCCAQRWWPRSDAPCPACIGYGDVTNKVRPREPLAPAPGVSATAVERREGLSPATPPNMSIGSRSELDGRVSFGEPAGLPALFDHDVAGVDLDDRLDGRILMAFKDRESTGMRPHVEVLVKIEVERFGAAFADALAYEPLARVAVAWALILDRFVYSTGKHLVRGHPAFTRVSHAMLLS